MITMLRRIHPRRLYAIGVLAGLTISCLSAGAQDNNWRYRKYKPPPPTSQITVTVLRADNGTPIPKAAVIFHPLKKNGKDEGGMELKANQDGKATMTVIPIGDTVLVQIIADGYQTYGKIYQIDKAKMAMKIRMKLPQPEYSIYAHHSAAASSEGAETGKAAKSPNSTPSAKGASPTPSRAKPSSSDKSKPSGPAKQAAQSGGGQSQAQSQTAQK
jgi:hypothetical protein